MFRWLFITPSKIAPPDVKIAALCSGECGEHAPRLILHFRVRWLFTTPGQILSAAAKNCIFVLVERRQQCPMHQAPHLPLPTADELVEALATDSYLTGMLSLVRKDAYAGYSGVDIIDNRILGTVKDEGVYAALVDIPPSERLLRVPFLQRLGFGVIVFIRGDDGDETEARDNCPFQVQFPGSTKTLHSRISKHESWLREQPYRPQPYMVCMWPRSFKQVRQRGVLKCVPRLLGWLRSARIALADPSRPSNTAALALERAEMESTSGAGTTLGPTPAERHAAEQATRKRKLTDAQFADACDTENGARWVGITEHGGGGGARARPMRIESVVADHFVFHALGPCEDPGPLASATVQTYPLKVLHREAFDIDWVRSVYKEGCHWSGSGLEASFEDRYVAAYKRVDDDDEDDEEEEDE